VRRNIRFAGAGGQGVILSSVLLAKAYGLGEGYNISQTQSYGPEARGGACKAELVVSDQEIDYMKVDKADLFIAYNQMGYDQYCNIVNEDACILINSTLVSAAAHNHYGVPATEIAEELGMPVAVNIVMLGALTKLLPDLKCETMKNEIVKSLDQKFQSGNLEAFEKGYRYMQSILDVPTSVPQNRNIMVCVTKQKTCDRLIEHGRSILGEQGGELSIIHVSQQQFNPFNHTKDGEALDYLYEKAMDHGVNITVVRSNDVVETLSNLALKNDIDCIVMGESRESGKNADLVTRLKQNIGDHARIEVVPRLTHMP